MLFPGCPPGRISPVLILVVGTSHRDKSSLRRVDHLAAQRLVSVARRAGSRAKPPGRQAWRASRCSAASASGATSSTSCAAATPRTTCFRWRPSASGPDCANGAGRGPGKVWCVWFSLLQEVDRSFGPGCAREAAAIYPRGSTAPFVVARRQVWWWQLPRAPGNAAGTCRGSLSGLLPVLLAPLACTADFLSGQGAAIGP